MTSNKPDRAAHSELPAPELEITPGMIRAGAEIVWRSFDGTIPYGSSFGEHVAVQVYRAICEQRARELSSKLSQKTR